MRCKRLIWLLVTAAVLVAGCTIDPPLHLKKTVQTRVVLTTSVTTSVMWQYNWQTLWTFPWNETVWGPLEYSNPAGLRMHIYTLGPSGSPVSHTAYNFDGLSGEVPVFIGTHDLLFHNNRSEVLLFRSDGDLADQYAYTRIISSGLKRTVPVKTLLQKASTKADDADDDFLPDEMVAYAPDELYTLFKPGFEITDDMSQYEYIDGKYVLRIKGNMAPASFIYLIQVNLANNFDRVIGCQGGAAITGVAPEVNMRTNITGSEAVTIPTDVRYDGDTNPDQLGIRIISFGIPGCNPYDAESVANAPDGKHFLVLSITYFDHTYKNIRVDITDQFRSLPTGGVITLDLDVNDFPPETSDGPITNGGGFDPLINPWQEETGGTSILS